MAYDNWTLDYYIVAICNAGRLGGDWGRLGEIWGEVGDSTGRTVTPNYFSGSGGSVMPGEKLR